MSRLLLIIDDESDIREVLRNSLEFAREWSILEAPDGERGLRLAAENKPDAILLDVMMPQMDGREVMRRLRSDPATSEIPVIFITASLQKEEIRNLGTLQPAGVLPKPFDPITIADEISKILHW